MFKVQCSKFKVQRKKYPHVGSLRHQVLLSQSSLFYCHTEISEITELKNIAMEKFNNQLTTLSIDVRILSVLKFTRIPTCRFISLR